PVTVRNVAAILLPEKPSRKQRRSQGRRLMSSRDRQDERTFLARSDRHILCHWEGPAMSLPATSIVARPVRLELGRVVLNGDLSLPAGAGGLIVFAHGSGSSRHSSRNRAVAEVLQQAQLGTL